MTTKSSRKTKKSSRAIRARALNGERGGKGIAGLFAGRALVTLLKLFISSPDREFYQRELSDLTGERLLSIQKALARLNRAGLIDRTTSGNRAYYRANKSHPAFQDLKVVVLKTFGVGDTLRAELRRFGERLRTAFIYGSVARGEETASSDIDIMLVGTLSGKEVAAIFAPLKRVLNREINPSVYSPAEFRRKVREGHPFLRTVLKEPKLFLLGDERDLKAVLGRRSA